MSARNVSDRYFASEGWREAVAQAEARTAQAVSILTDGATQDAAAAFQTLLEHPDHHERIIRATIRFTDDRQRQEWARQGDLDRLLAELREVQEKIGHLTDRAGRLHDQFLPVPGLPIRSELSIPSADAFIAVDGIVEAVERMVCAVQSAHGPDRGGPRALALELAGAPLDAFAIALADIWHDAGRTLMRADRRMFEAILSALLEALTGDGEVPEKLIARIKAARKSERTPL